MNIVRIARLLATIVCSVAASTTIAAEALKLIIPTAPGGGTDGYFRVLAREVEPVLNEPVVVMNVPGAGGTIGVAQMVRANRTLRIETVTGPEGTTTFVVTRTKHGKIKRVPVRILRTVTGPGGTQTMAVAVAGPAITPMSVWPRLTT